MDSILLIIQYIFQKKKQRIDFDSIDSFFDDGISFPTFVSLIFDVDQVPNIITNPESEEDKETNNDTALQYLLENNEGIAEMNPSYDSERDKNDLLQLILTKQCFTLDHAKILDVFNSLVKPLNIHFDDEDELINLGNLISILHILTDKKVKNVTDDVDDIDDLLVKSFKKAKVPLIINSNTLDDQNPFNFYIQLEIIFDNLLDENQKNEYLRSSENISLSQIPKSKKKSRFWDFLRRKTENADYSSDTSEYVSDDEDEKENEDMQNEALLKTINAIGSKSGIHFTDFDSAVQNDAIPKFVMKFFNCESIENVKIQDESQEKKSRIYSGRLTKEQIQNIEAVIEFLKKKKEKFKILLFDFEDIHNIESSTILFYTNFLNCFFIKKLKQEMYQRTARILCSHTSKFNEKYNDILFTKYKIYPCLLHFIKKGNLHFEFDYHKVKFTDNAVSPFFENAKIPMIINRYLLLYAKKYVSFPIFYQLQFIFDALDNESHRSCNLVELLMNTFFSLKNIKVPKFSELATSIKAKQLSLRYQDEMGNKYRHRNESKSKDYIKKVKKEIIPPKTFNDFCSENEGSLNKMKELIQKVPSSKIESKSFDDFWNSPDKNYSNDKGIVYNKVFNQENKSKSLNDWTSEMKNIQEKSLQIIEDLKQLNSSENNEKDKQPLLFGRRKSGCEPKLNKLFVYNEQLKKWEFNQENFESFSKEKKINVKDSKAPLVLFFNSYEDDETMVNSNLINTLYPNLEKENPDEIFVYALCDRSLTMLNFYVDFNNAEKASIKPIFLLLHVPKSKEKHPHIRLIITQIYSFLSTVCDFEVTVLNSSHYLDQIEFIKEVLKINDNSGLYDKNDKKIPFSFVYQNYSSSSSKSALNKKDDDNDVTFVYKEPKFVFLVNDPSIKFNQEIDHILSDSEFFKNLVSQFNKEYHLHYININQNETYEGFLTCMNDIIMKKCCCFWELELNFKCIENYNFSETYLQLIIKDCFIDDLELLVNQRLKMLDLTKGQNSAEKSTNNKKEKEEEESKTKKSSKDKKSSKNKKKSTDEETETNEEKEQVEEIEDDLFSSEIKKVFPSKNVDLFMNCMSIKKKFLEHNDCCNETIRKILKENLQNSSNSNLTFIDQYINTKYFWKYQQMADMINSHKKFLKKEFLSIVQNLISEDLFESTFELNFDIVENQLKKDQARIMKIMQPFIDKINIKNCTKIHDLRNTMKEGTNYAMKETENLREVKITVSIDKDLKSEIPQDF